MAAINRKTTDAQVKAAFSRRAALYRRAVLDSLVRIGEKCVAEARKHGLYTDRTGNLRSSTGYVVTDGGTVVARSAFDTVRGQAGRQLSGESGREEGLKCVERVVAFSSKIQLTLVAGMPYAQWVEDKNKNVLDSAEQLAASEMARLKEKFSIKQ